MKDAKKNKEQIVALIGILTLIAWLAGSLLFAFYLERFSNYAATYAGLASMMIANPHNLPNRSSFETFEWNLASNSQSSRMILEKFEIHQLKF